MPELSFSNINFDNLNEDIDSFREKLKTKSIPNTPEIQEKFAELNIQLSELLMEFNHENGTG